MFGAMPVVFYEAIEAAIVETLRHGLHGWQVIDCVVVVTDAAHTAPMSTAADFRKLTPLVLMAAVQAAGTVVCEPVHRFDLDLPTDALAPVLSLLARLHAMPDPPEAGLRTCRVSGEIAAARVHEVQLQLPRLTHGEGVLETAFEGYRALSGTPPSRVRADHNPLNRKQYLLHVQRRLPATIGGDK
jgi:ribosomal protection tetracycline resistance protein